MKKTLIFISLFLILTSSLSSCDWLDELFAEEELSDDYLGSTVNYCTTNVSGCSSSQYSCDNSAYCYSTLSECISSATCNTGTNTGSGTNTSTGSNTGSGNTGSGSNTTTPNFVIGTFTNNTGWKVGNTSAGFTLHNSIRVSMEVKSSTLTNRHYYLVTFKNNGSQEFSGGARITNNSPTNAHFSLTLKAGESKVWGEHLPSNLSVVYVYLRKDK